MFLRCLVSRSQCVTVIQTRYSASGYVTWTGKQNDVGVIGQGTSVDAAALVL